MRLRRYRLLFHFLIAASPTFVGAAGATLGQAAHTFNSVEQRTDDIYRQARDQERDNRACAPKSKAAAGAAKQTRRNRMEIEKDLLSLQTIFNELVTALQTNNDLQPGFAAETGRTVRKLALRLRSNLQLPALDQDDARTAPPPLPETDRKSLTALCKVIYSFITNSIFDGTNVLDVKNGTRAGMDLDEIIRIAEHLSSVPELAPR